MSSLKKTQSIPGLFTNPKYSWFIHKRQQNVLSLSPLGLLKWYWKQCVVRPNQPTVTLMSTEYALLRTVCIALMILLLLLHFGHNLIMNLYTTALFKIFQM